ncbi:DUF6286 domain-containing protein [Fodinicola acaciae]|uniref:DUF6286 domain-containing protein n=1 Tax=Fodinicola acaciae TaxID=2681555 RepID=UPI0013D1F9D7|nr:DUF6286 domain-containing protein [Fodinicola acaciae]
MKRRTRRRLPATVTAVVLLAACAAVAVFAIQMILGRTPVVDFPAVAGTLHATRWSDLAPAVIAAVIAVLGLVLLVLAILPGKLRVIPLDGPVPSGAARHSYRGMLRTAASTVDGVAGASVRLRGKRLLVKVSTRRTETAGLADAVRAAVGERLDRIGPAMRPTVRVRVRRTR